MECEVIALVWSTALSHTLVVRSIDSPHLSRTDGDAASIRPSVRVRSFRPRPSGSYALDHQGHGRSGGDRVHIECAMDMVEDILHLTALAKEEVRYAVQ